MANAVSPTDPDLDPSRYPLSIFGHLQTKLDIHRILFMGLLMPTLTVLLVVAISALKTTKKGEDLTRGDAEQHAHLQRDVQPPSEDAAMYVIRCAIIPLLSLVLLDPNLPIRYRLGVQFSGPILMFALSYRQTPTQRRHLAWLLFVVSGSGLAFGILWLLLYLSRDVRWNTAQALVSWTIAAFIWITEAVTHKSHLKRQKPLNTELQRPAPRSDRHPLINHESRPGKSRSDQHLHGNQPSSPWAESWTRAQRGTFVWTLFKTHKPRGILAGL